MAKRSRKLAKRVGRGLRRAAPIVLPAAGAIFGGSLYAGGGTLLATGIAATGSSKGRRARIKRAALTGAGITAGAAALGLVSGAGVTAPLTSSIPQLFGSGAKSPGTTGGGAGPGPESFLLDPAQRSGSTVPGTGGPGAESFLDPIASAYFKSQQPTSPMPLTSPQVGAVASSVGLAGSQEPGGLIAPRGGEPLGTEGGFFKNPVAIAVVVGVGALLLLKAA